MATGTYGGLSPGFERYGGHRSDVLQAILTSIGVQRGTAQDTSSSSNVYPENMAAARAIAEVWSNLNRMANQYDANRMTDFIPRWEKIFGLVPASNATDVDRRKAIANAFAIATNLAVYRSVVDILTALLGPVFVGLSPAQISSAGAPATGGPIADVWTPAGWAVGTHDSSLAVNWYSTVAMVTVLVAQPATMADVDFYQTVALMEPVLDAFLPAWVTWQWIRSAPFYLDSGYSGGVVPAGVTPVNLDNEGLQ